MAKKFNAAAAIKRVTIALAAVDGGGAMASWKNPEGETIEIIRTTLKAVTIAAAACPVDVGTTSVSGATASDNLIDGADVHVAGVYSNAANAGANGKAGQILAADNWVTAQSADAGAAAGVVGTLTILYQVLSA